MNRLMSWGLASAIVILSFFVTINVLPERRPLEAAICNSDVPLGAVAPQRPEWCDHTGQYSIDTHHEGPNAWRDDFNHGNVHAKIPPAYAVGTANASACDILHWAHNNHWMIDYQGNNGEYPTLCGAWLRPNRTFRVQTDGTVVIEFEVASPIAGTRDSDELSDSWPEVIVSTAPAPTTLRANGTYLYEAFVGHWTFGCRMQQSRHPICALYEPSDGFAGGPTRQWEVNQNGGEVQDDWNGGPATPGSPVYNAWKGCDSRQDPDTACRNVHRLVLSNNRMQFYHLDSQTGQWVEGYGAVLEDNQLGNILNGPFYVYVGDFAYRISQDVVLRTHWDHLAVNPGLLSGSQPTPPTATPTRTATPRPGTATPTRTPTPRPATATPTPTGPLPSVTEDFESGGWSSGAGWTNAWNRTGYWVFSTITTRSAPQAGSQHVRLQSDASITRAFSLQDARSATLTFWAKADSWENGDGALVQISSDNRTWTTVSSFANGFDTNRYEQRQISLGQWAGQTTVYLRILGRMGRVGDYFYVDSIQITQAR